MSPPTPYGGRPIQQTTEVSRAGTYLSGPPRHPPYTALQNEIFGREPGFFNHHDNEALQRLRQEQTLLGWGQLFRGRLSCRWAEIQHAFQSTLVVD
jgi:hypothetical protein